MIPDLSTLVNAAGIEGYNRIENRVDVAYWNNDRQMFVSAGAVITDVGILLWMSRGMKEEDGSWDMTLVGYTPDNFEQNLVEVGLEDQWILKETLQFYMAGREEE